jgi:hypothetical protein
MHFHKIFIAETRWSRGTTKDNNPEKEAEKQTRAEGQKKKDEEEEDIINRQV